MPEELEKIQQNTESNPEANIDPLEQIRQKMAEQQIPVTEKDGEFFTESSAGKINVEIPDQNETLFSQAKEVEERESKIKKELEDSNAPVEVQIETGRKTMRENKQAFTEAQDIQNIINQLSAEGKILTAQNYDIANNQDITQSGLHFIISPEALKNVEQAAKKLGYNVSIIPGKGITINSAFATYTFLTGKNLEGAQNQSAPENEEDSYDDEEENKEQKASGLKQKKTRKTKNKLGSTGSKSSIIVGGTKGKKNISIPNKGKDMGSQAHDINEPHSIIPPIIGPAPTYRGETGPITIKPEQQNVSPNNPNISGGSATGIEGGGIEGIAPGAN